MLNTINLENLEQVTGGKKNVVHNPHKRYSYVNCRKKPDLNSKVFFKIPNGERVYPTGKVVRNNGFDWYEIKLAGGYKTGWVAGHLIGR